MNLAQLSAERERAGAAYAAALVAFRCAWVNLAAVERTLQNNNIAPDSVRTFHFARRHMDEGLRSLQHHEFTPRILASEWCEAMTALSDKQIEGFAP